MIDQDGMDAARLLPVTPCGRFSGWQFAFEIWSDVIIHGNQVDRLRRLRPTRAAVHRRPTYVQDCCQLER